MSGGYDSSVRLWDVGSGRHLQTFSGHASDVLSVDFSPDGLTLASGSSDETIRLWNAETGEYLRTFAEHTSNG